MKRSIQILSKKPRQEEVSVMAEEGNEASAVVRVTFKEIPEAEFDSLEGQLRGRVVALGQFLREAAKIEGDLKEALEASQQGRELALTQQQTVVKFKNLSESLDDMRREIVSKVVIGHRPEDFELTDLPLPTDPEELKAEVEALLADDYGASQDDIRQAFEVGAYLLPFRGAAWQYESRGTVREMPGAHPLTIRAYEKFQQGGKLLRSLCNAALQWHRLNLKSAETLKAELVTSRVSHRAQAQRLNSLLKAGLLKPERAQFLLSLDVETFDQVVTVLVEASTLTLGIIERGNPKKALLITEGQVALNPS